MPQNSDAFFDHLSSNNAPACRICLVSESNSQTGKLLQPCNCKGSVKYVHANCLKKSILYSKKRGEDVIKCELCLETYKMTLTLGRKNNDMPNLRKGLIFFISILSLFSIWVLWKIVRAIEILCTMEEDPFGDYDYDQEFLGEKVHRGVKILGFSASVILVCLKAIRYMKKNSETRWNIYNKNEEVPRDMKLLTKLQTLRKLERPQKKL